MKFQLGILGVLSAALIVACNTSAVQPQAKQALGVLEVQFDTAGVSTAKFEHNNTRALTFREADAVFGTGTTNVISSLNDPFDYLVASFPVSHAVSSALAFQNLTLYALAKAGNVGDTAIKTIANFGGVTNATEQTRLAKLLIPVHAVQLDGAGNVVMDNANADFQAFSSQEVMDATTAAGSSITALDTILNYGFTAHCLTVCTTNSRVIPITGTGKITIAIRVPKAALSTSYKFVMNFAVLDESVARVTKGVYPPESVAQAETRGSSLGATDLMQFGLNQSSISASLNNISVNDVNTSKLGASINALSIGRISAGSNYTCGLTSSGTAYCWGDNTYGQLGDNTNTNSNVPVAVSGNYVFSSISAGLSHSCGLTSSGTAYCWGDNLEGELGNNTFAPSSIPVAVSGGHIFSSISARAELSCGLTSSGAAYCWGFNHYGQLGNNDATSSSSSLPVLVDGGYTFASIGVGYANSCGLTLGGTAYCWGDNTYGQLGNNTNTNASIPVAVSGNYTFSSISIGFNHSCGVTSSGTAYCWGKNANGRLGDNTTTDSSIPVLVSGNYTFSNIGAGNDHSCGLTPSGTAYCWGYNGNGVLGNNDSNLIESSVPVAVSGGYTFSSISDGGSQSCGLTSIGTAYCWGENVSGELGDNTNTNSSVPIPVMNTLFSL